MPPHEVETLIALVLDLLDALEPGVLDQQDPVYQRLYPDAHRQDADAAQAFRELTETSLRTERRIRAEAMVAELRGARSGRRNRIVDLDPASADAWLKVLNDLRLAIGTRLDITDDEPPAAAKPGDPQAATYSVYAYLTAVQDRLVAALMG
jgi:hypothetical protein